MQSEDRDKGAAGLKHYFRLQMESGASLLFSYFMKPPVSVTSLSPFFLSFLPSPLSALQKTDLGQEFYTVARGKTQTIIIKSVGSKVSSRKFFNQNVILRSPRQLQRCHS